MPNDAESVLRQAAEAVKNEQYAHAEALQRKGCELLREQQVEQSRLAAEIEKLAGIHFAQQKFEQSASEYAEALKLQETALPKNDAAILTSLFRLAKAHFEARHYESAEVEMRKALSLAESRSDWPQGVAFYSYELGWFLYFVGKYAEAEPYLLRALSICESVHGLSHHQTIKTLGAIALLYSNCPALKKDAEPYFTKILATTKPTGELRETYLTNLCRLAGYLAERKEFEKADESYSQLVALLGDSAQSLDSDGHWMVSSCVEYFKSRGKDEMVAHLVPASRDYNAYGDIVRQRLAHAEQTLSPDDAEYAEALLAAGNHFVYEGDYEEAERLLTRSLDASTKIHGQTSSQALFALNRVSIVKRLLGKFDEAETAIQRALNGAKKHFSEDSLYPYTLENLALLREAEAKPDDAASIYEEAIGEYERILGFPSYETAEALYHQSGCLLRIGRTAPAEAAIRRAISRMDEIENQTISRHSLQF